MTRACTFLPTFEATPMILHLGLFVTPLYTVFRKNCVFFKIPSNPSLAYIVVTDLQSSQRYASVQSLRMAGIFFIQPIAAEIWRERGGKLSSILGKKTQYLMNTL